MNVNISFMRREAIKSCLSKSPKTSLNLLGIKYFTKYKSKISFHPFSLDIEPTVRCNLNCKYCQVPGWERGKKVRDLSLIDFKRIVDQFPNLLIIKLQGMGEPLLNKDLWGMIDYASSKKIIVRTNSNGTLIDESMARRIINSKLTAISISLDGATKETYDKIRRGAKFEKVIGNIKTLIKLRGTSRLPRINVWMVATTENYSEIPEMIELCADLGVDKLTVQTKLGFWGKEDMKEKLEDFLLDINSDELKRIKEESTELAKKLNFNLNFYYSNWYGTDSKCPWPWESCYITTDGYVVPCCIIANPEVINFGNILDKPFKEIWNSKKYVEFRDKIKDNEIPSYCGGCYL
ncbi:MAG: radical SAM protein [Nanoarchaeota archaeon]|nr:radical SAM protein [Nanoarchaeota archaeon]MCG2717778.1 radical SAM protein [Nanoarchaeota archaeon]